MWRSARVNLESNSHHSHAVQTSIRICAEFSSSRPSLCYVLKEFFYDRFFLKCFFDVLKGFFYALKSYSYVLKGFFYVLKRYSYVLMGGLVSSSRVLPAWMDRKRRCCLATLTCLRTPTVEACMVLCVLVSMVPAFHAVDEDAHNNSSTRIIDACVVATIVV